MEYMEQQMDNQIQASLEHQKELQEIKLTPESLFYYLPYGLEVDILNYKQDYVGISKSVLTGYYPLYDNIETKENFSWHFTYEGGSTGKSTDLLKPYLRKLSRNDLEWFQKNINKYITKLHITKNKPGTLLKLQVSLDNGFGLLHNLTFEQHQLLFKAKFDMFDLIESGLANDMDI